MCRGLVAGCCAAMLALDASSTGPAQAAQAQAGVEGISATIVPTAAREVRAVVPHPFSSQLVVLDNGAVVRLPPAGDEASESVVIVEGVDWGGGGAATFTAERLLVLGAVANGAPTVQAFRQSANEETIDASDPIWSAEGLPESGFIAQMAHGRGALYVVASAEPGKLLQGFIGSNASELSVLADATEDFGPGAKFSAVTVHQAVTGGDKGGELAAIVTDGDARSWLVFWGARTGRLLAKASIDVEQPASLAYRPSNESSRPDRLYVAGRGGLYRLDQTRDGVAAVLVHAVDRARSAVFASDGTGFLLGNSNGPEDEDSLQIIRLTGDF